MSLPLTVEVQIETVRRIGARLLNTHVMSIEPIGGGRNSHVCRLTTAEGQTFALKIYFQHPNDSRDRVSTEFTSLRFLWEAGVRDVPQPIAADPEMACAVYEFVDGERIDSASVSDTEIDTAVQFLVRLRALCEHPASRNLHPASEACFSMQAIASSIRQRLGHLKNCEVVDALNEELEIFLDDEVVPTLDRVVRWSQKKVVRAGKSFQRELDFEERTLSPSDFGFHNALRRSGGQIVFLDFEYFGWDDPAKTVCDFLLHPAMSLSESQKKRFCNRVVLHFYPSLAQRVESVYPLFGLKWCTILLNEFLPVHLLRRQFSGSTQNRYLMRKQQLDKAKQMLNMIKQEYDSFPYFN